MSGDDEEEEEEDEGSVEKTLEASSFGGANPGLSKFAGSEGPSGFGGGKIPNAGFRPGIFKNPT